MRRSGEVVEKKSHGKPEREWEEEVLGGQSGGKGDEHGEHARDICSWDGFSVHASLVPPCDA